MTDLQSLLRLPATVLFDRDADGRLLIGCDEPGTTQLYELADGSRRRLTDFAEPVTGRYLPGRRAVVLQQDEGGNERHQIFVLDIADRTSGNDIAAGELTAVTDDPEHVHDLAGVSRDGRLIAYTSNRRNGVDFDVYVHDLGSGEVRCVYDGGGWCQGQDFSPDGRYLTFERPGGYPMDNDLLLADLSTGQVRVLTEHEEPAHCSAPAWLPDSSAFYFSTNDGRDVMAVARYDLATDTVKQVLDGEWDTECFTSEDGSTLLVVANQDGTSRLSLYDAASLDRLGTVPTPGVGVAAWNRLVPGPVLAPDGAAVTYTFTGPAQPSCVWRHDRGAPAPTRLAGATPPDGLAEPDTARVPSFDGEQIPVAMYRPAGVERPPVVLHVHGGPESQARPIFSPVIQGLVARGYAVLVPNVRGSTGYGKRYYGLDDTTRRLDSVSDLGALHGALAGLGLDASRASLWGGSYGGYMVLAGVSMLPDLWAAGIDIVGISDLVTFLENTSAYRRAHREREYGSLDHDREFLRTASPLTYVDRIRAPLFVVHGANDPRVPLSEAQQIVASLAERGIDHDLLVYADEGHGLAKLGNRLDAYPRAVDFLDRVVRRTREG